MSTCLRFGLPGRLLRYRILSAGHSSFLVLLLALLCSQVQSAEKPQIERLFPPGGQQGTTVTVSVTGKPGDGPLQAWTEAGQLTFVVAEKGDSINVAIPPDALPGVHWIRFFNGHGASDLKPFVVGHLPEVLEAEPNNKLSEAQRISSSTSVVNGVLQESGDVDTYGISLTKGQTLVVSMLARRELNSPMDASLQLLNPGGTVVEQNDDDHGNDPQLVHKAGEDGIFFVRTFAFPSEPNSTIQFSGAATYVYRLTMTTGPFADQTMPMAVEEGRPTEVKAVGWNIPQDRVAVELTAVPDMPSSTLFAGDLAEPVQVDSVRHPSWLESEVQRRGLPDRMPPFSVSGVISQSDEVDSYWFAGRKDQKLRIAVVARARYSMLDPVVTVSTEAGQVLATADDIDGSNADAAVDVTLSTDGRYRIVVSDRFSHGGPRFFYRLVCEEPQPDFAVTTAETALLMTLDQPLSIPLTVDRRHGFLNVVDFQISGLPEGLVLESMRSEKDGDTSKAVTLKLTGSSAAGFSGPVRIQAMAIDGPVRTVHGAIAGSGTVTHWIWLTVPAKPADAPAEPAEDKATVPPS